MSNFYNPKTKEIISTTELSRRYNVSIPAGLNEIQGFYKIFQGNYPEHGPYDSVVLDKIRKTNGKYTQLYKVVPEELEAKKERLKNYVKNYLNDTVLEKDYDSIENACSYVNSTNPTFAAEAQKAIKFRDDVWIVAYEMLDSENLADITDAYFSSQLPTLNWEDE